MTNHPAKCGLQGPRPDRRPRLVGTLVGLLAVAITGCDTGQRTINSNTTGTRIPVEIAESLRPGLTDTDWLVLHYGEPDQRTGTDQGGTILTWTWVRDVREIRPDPHRERLTIQSHVELDGAGRIVRAWRESAEKRFD